MGESLFHGVDNDTAMRKRVPTRGVPFSWNTVSAQDLPVNNILNSSIVSYTYTVFLTIVNVALKLISTVPGNYLLYYFLKNKNQYFIL